MTLTVYGDFTDPLSRIASLRSDALRAAGWDVDWRAVAATRSTRAVAEPADAEFRERVADAASWLQQHCLPTERLQMTAPGIAACPDPPISGFAEAVGAGVADHVRRLLFRSYWLDGLDIGSPEVLRRLLAVPILHGRSPSEVLSVSGYAVAVNGVPITTAAWQRVRRWRASWEDLGRPPLPVVVDNDTYSGFEALARLRALVGQHRLPPIGSNPYPLPPLPIQARRVSLLRPGLRPAWWDRDEALAP